MIAVKKIKPQWLKSIMWLSYGLLIFFAAQWLYNQYEQHEQQLQKDVNTLFTDVQEQIADSILLNDVADPSIVNKTAIEHIVASGKQKTTDNITLSPQGLHLMLKSLSNITGAEEKRLFRLDTIAFNDIFSSRMQQNGWHFSAHWIDSKDSNNRQAKSIFIPSNFFTHENGVVVGNYNGYLLRSVLPQLLFILFLLSVTGFAFWLAYRSLQEQIRLGKLKDDFISNMSHELKTPIATVKVVLEALNNFNVIEQPQLSREYLGMATTEMDRLELLATRVLNTSVIENGTLQLQQESYDLKKLVEEVLQAMQLRFAQAGASVTLYVSGNAFAIPIDKLHIQGTLVNLIDNSLKYGVSPVHIHITLTEANGKVQLALTDNGPGIPEEYHNKVFDKFFRVPTGNRHNTKGYGLGLSYAAQVLRQHNGSINLSNIATGGCRFTLTF
ncbi:MAG: sensor histidine kinase [Flavipsychrobacter sp.]